MAVRKVLARGFKVEINTGTEQAPVWTPIKGLETIGFATSKTDADTTDMDSNGNDEHVVASRSREITLEGFWLEDKQTGERDPGQEAVDALNEAVGDESLGEFRLTTPGGKVRRFLASVSVEGPTGGKNEMAKWNATLTVSGAVTHEP